MHLANHLLLLLALTIGDPLTPIEWRHYDQGELRFNYPSTLHVTSEDTTVVLSSSHGMKIRIAKARTEASLGTILKRAVADIRRGYEVQGVRYEPQPTSGAKASRRGSTERFEQLLSYRHLGTTYHQELICWRTLHRHTVLVVATYRLDETDEAEEVLRELTRSIE